MTDRSLFVGIAVLAMLTGTALWLAARPAGPALPVDVPSTASLFAVEFTDARGGPQTLGRFQGKPMVINFWATWCAPCREEMPAFARLQRKWAGRVQFVGLSSDEAAKVTRFAAENAVDYPLWVGDDRVGELSRRLGNARGVLPFTVLLDSRGSLVEMRAGPYSEIEMDEKLRGITLISG